MDPLELRVPSLVNARRLKLLLSSLRHRARTSSERRATRLLSSKALIRGARLERTTELHLARLGTSDKRTLDPRDHERLVDFLWMQGFIDGSHELVRALHASPDALHHALMLWNGGDKREMAELGRRVEGCYRYWRPWGGSSTVFSVGSLIVRHDRVSQAIRVTEHCTTGTSNVLERKPVTLGGCLVGNLAHFYCLMSGWAEGELSFVALSGLTAGDRFVALNGVACGFAEGNLSSLPLFAQWLEGESPDACYAGTVHARDVPAQVRVRLEGLAAQLRIGRPGETGMGDDPPVA